VPEIQCSSDIAGPYVRVRIAAIASLSHGGNHSSATYYGSVVAVQEGGINVYKDINILANHLHGFYGNPGTENIACSPLPDNSSDCYRGDNIFADIPPGSCNYYQYDFADVASPGALW